MSVRRKLIILLSGLAAFAVLAAAATIYSIRWQMGGAVRNFEHSMGLAIDIERLQFTLEEQLFYLRQMIGGSTESVRPYFQTRDEFFTSLRQAARFSPEGKREEDTSELLRLAETFEQESDRCLDLLRGSPSEKPRLENMPAIALPAARPAMPISPFMSPPPRRSIALHGQPRKARTPSMANIPSRKRTNGAEPPLDRQDSENSAATAAPRTTPMTSGLTYCRGAK